MPMIPHDCETKDIHKIDVTEVSDYIQQLVFLNIAKWKAGQGGSGYDVVNGRSVRQSESGISGHGLPPWDEGLVLMEGYLPEME